MGYVIFREGIFLICLKKQHATATTMGHKHGNVPNYLGKNCLLVMFLWKPHVGTIRKNLSIGK